jgi:hypothetical protein
VQPRIASDILETLEDTSGMLKFGGFVTFCKKYKLFCSLQIPPYVGPKQVIIDTQDLSFYAYPIKKRVLINSISTHLSYRLHK